MRIKNSLIILWLFFAITLSAQEKTQSASASDFQRAKALRVYIDKNDWEGFRNGISKVSLAPLSASGLYHSAAIKIAEQPGANLNYAEEFAREAMKIAKTEWSKARPATGVEAKRSSGIAWSGYYPRYVDAYAAILYKLGKYEQGYALAKEATFTLNKGQHPDYNTTYALLAEKILPEQQYKKELEQFVKDAKATPQIKDLLKRVYIKQNKSEAGFENYLSALQNDLYLKMLADLRKKMISQKSPAFTLADLNGNKVDMKNLKGKIVIIDFWASWCAPCKASFPAMQRVVNKYKNDPHVKFYFIDTWEKIANKEKVAADFINKHKYSFEVLMDNEDKVVKQFNVSGIPTKFVIDKNGFIRFVSVDFKEHEDDKLVNELSAMIEVTRDASK